MLWRLAFALSAPVVGPAWGARHAAPARPRAPPPPASLPCTPRRQPAPPDPCWRLCAPTKAAAFGNIASRTLRGGAPFWLERTRRPPLQEWRRPGQEPGIRSGLFCIPNCLQSCSILLLSTAGVDRRRTGPKQQGNGYKNFHAPRPPAAEPSAGVWGLRDCRKLARKRCSASEGCVGGSARSSGCVTVSDRGRAARPRTTGAAHVPQRTSLQPGRARAQEGPGGLAAAAPRAQAAGSARCQEGKVVLFQGCRANV